MEEFGQQIRKNLQTSKISTRKNSDEISTKQIKENEDLLGSPIVTKPTGKAVYKSITERKSKFSSKW